VFGATLAAREIVLLSGAHVDARYAAAATLLGLVYVAGGSLELVTNSLTPLVIRAVGAPAMALGGIALMAAPLLLSGQAVRSVLAVVLTSDRDQRRQRRRRRRQRAAA
jgi:hypothetical protein